MQLGSKGTLDKQRYRNVQKLRASGGITRIEGRGYVRVPRG